MSSLSRSIKGCVAPLFFSSIFFFFFTASLYPGSNKDINFYRWLVKEGDYYRAIGELRRIQWNSPSEKWFQIEKEILHLYQISGHIKEGLREWESFSKLHKNIVKGKEKEWLLIKTKLLLSKGYFSKVYPLLSTISTLPEGRKIYKIVKKREAILLSFENDKSPLLAGILSSIIPGSGQWYAGMYGNGIFTFLIISALTGGTYYLYMKNSPFYPLTLSLSLFFYAGNIYGAVTSTHRVNLIRKWKEWEYIKEREDFNHLIEIKSPPTLLQNNALLFQLSFNF